MTWLTDTDMAGERVIMYFGGSYEDGESGTVVAEHENGSVIKVLGDDGETYIGNQFDPE